MDDAQARRILRDSGEEPPARGRLSPQWTARAEELAADDITDADFDGEPGEQFTAPPALPPENKPGKVRRPGPSFRTRGRKAARPGKEKKKHPRVRVDSLISSAWAALGGLAGNVDPPLGRCLIMQAPVSGLILEDVIKGTAADRVLQPIARAEEKAEKVLALFAPPAIVAALEVSATLPEPQRRAREAILIPLLERSMVLWVRIAGDKIDQQLARQAEEEPARQKARELLAMIWAPAAPDTPADEPATA